MIKFWKHKQDKEKITELEGQITTLTKERDDLIAQPYYPRGKVMICDRGRSGDMRLFPMCTWEGGAKCSGLEKHKYDPATCGRHFCMRAGVWRQCEYVGQ